MSTITVTVRPSSRHSHCLTRALSSALCALVLCIVSSNPVLAEEYVEEPYAEETYAEEPYESGETYYQEDYNNNEEYQEEQSIDSGDTYNDSAAEVMEPTMDPEHADMVREAKASCSQWAAESGLENEDKQAFIDDCVYSQTGY